MTPKRYKSDGLRVRDGSRWIRVEILCGIESSRAFMANLSRQSIQMLASTVLCMSYLFDTFIPQPKQRVVKDPEHISAPDTWSESSPTAL